MMSRARVLTSAVIVIAVLAMTLGAQQAKIYWADEVPKGWNGKWPAKFLTVPEKTNYARTTSTLDLAEFVDTVKWNSENVAVINVFTSAMRKVAPAIVLANPRVTSPQEAVKSGKPVMFIQGNIHPAEPEGTEAILMAMREILFGAKKPLLDNQIVIFLPVFNVDGTDTFTTQDGTPHIVGQRTNAAGLDLNRDAVKLESVEAIGLYQNLLNRWDPVLLVDLHLMGRVNHGYANTYATCTMPTAHPAPRGYVWDTLFPAVRTAVRQDFGLETFTHCLFDESKWPPTEWSHDRAIWSNEAKFIVNDYGLRNRMAIITETPGHPAFERRICAQYAYVLSLLAFTNAHGREMQKICKDADEETAAKVRAHAESWELKNWIAGKYESWGKIDLLAYRTNVTAFIPGTSVRATTPGSAGAPPEVVHDVEHLTKPVGTREAVMPRGYLIPGDLQDLVAKLRTHNIRVQQLDKPIKAIGDEFVADRMIKTRPGNMTALEGGFFGASTREFPAGTYYLDMAQPMANAAFYYLEPQSADGFVGWGVLDSYLKSLGVDQHPVVYPVFKFRREVK
jgi:hypothetical protein